MLGGLRFKGFGFEVRGYKALGLSTATGLSLGFKA